METIVYIAPGAPGNREQQRALIEAAGVTEDRFIRVDWPKKPSDPIPREQRDFVFGHMLRSAVQNADGKPDRLMVVGIGALGETKAEITRLFRALVKLGVPLVSLTDKLDGDSIGTEFVLRWIDALDRAEDIRQRWLKAARPAKRPRKGTATGGRPRALTDAEISEARQMRASGMKWADIQRNLKDRGRKVAISTLRGLCSRGT